MLTFIVWYLLGIIGCVIAHFTLAKIRTYGDIVEATIIALSGPFILTISLFALVGKYWDTKLPWNKK